MCGIGGLFSTRPIDSVPVKESLTRMRTALDHRGPDGCGIQIFDHAALVHTRLAIIDVEGGQQPLHSPSGKTCIIFNGEIYNYGELRARLPDYPFRTRSDTEVIVALYETEGVEGWRRLRGMFAFALWDVLAGKGFLARDPLGIKPLFYREENGMLFFASEAKGILAHGGEKAIDLSALHRLLNFRYITGEDSLFSGISQLAPGKILRWDVGGSSQSLLAPLAEGGPTSLAEALQTAVQRHLVADVPVGCFLSGGIDSALVARLAVPHTALTSYTLKVGDDPLEASNAAATASWLGIPNHCRPFALDDPIAAHQTMVYHLETPKVNALQGMMLAEFTVGHVKVALSGLGSDELFYGYNAHQIMWLMQQATRLLPVNTNRFVASALDGMLAKKIAWSEPERALAMLAAAPDWARVYGVLRNVWDAPHLRRIVYGERLLDTNPPDCFDWLQARFPAGADAAQSMAEFELENKLVNDLLWQEDRMSMRVGLETRVPFLDWDLVRHARALSRSELMPYGQKKHALRRYARSVLSSDILRRRKSGFQMDIVTASQTLLKPVFDEYLSEERIACHRLFNGNFVRAVRARPPGKGLRWHVFLLYLMAQTHIFLETFHAG
jgi:asparagine synthase (glutamine-hydrolysing)